MPTAKGVVRLHLAVISIAPSVDADSEMGVVRLHLAVISISHTDEIHWTWV